MVLKLQTKQEMPKPEPVLEFDLTKPFPEKVGHRKFSPSLIDHALKAGYFVLARVNEAPVEVAVSKARWSLSGARN